MQNSTRSHEPEAMVTKRSLGWAGAAAFLACAACCAFPLLAVAGGGTLAAMTAWLTPGMELYVAAPAALGTLAFFALRSRRARPCDTSCAADASCCPDSSAQRRTS
jgi:hypothetical protein